MLSSQSQITVQLSETRLETYFVAKEPGVFCYKGTAKIALTYHPKTSAEFYRLAKQLKKQTDGLTEDFLLHRLKLVSSLFSDVIDYKKSRSKIAKLEAPIRELEEKIQRQRLQNIYKLLAEPTPPATVVKAAPSFQMRQFKAAQQITNELKLENPSSNVRALVEAIAAAEVKINELKDQINKKIEVAKKIHLPNIKPWVLPENLKDTIYQRCLNAEALIKRHCINAIPPDNFYNIYLNGYVSREEFNEYCFLEGKFNFDVAVEKAINVAIALALDLFIEKEEHYKQFTKLDNIREQIFIYYQTRKQIPMDDIIKQATAQLDAALKAEEVTLAKAKKDLQAAIETSKASTITSKPKGLGNQ